MALVYNSTVIPIGAKVFGSINIPLYPRIRRGFAIDFNIQGRILSGFQSVYAITDYEKVGGSVDVVYSGRVQGSKSIPYSFEFRVLDSTDVVFGATLDVYKATSINYAIPGYTRVVGSRRVLMRFDNMAFIQPSTVVKLEKL